MPKVATINLCTNQGKINQTCYAKISVIILILMTGRQYCTSLTIPIILKDWMELTKISVEKFFVLRKDVAEKNCGKKLRKEIVEVNCGSKLMRKSIDESVLDQEIRKKKTRTRIKQIKGRLLYFYISYRLISITSHFSTFYFI